MSKQRYAKLITTQSLSKLCRAILVSVVVSDHQINPYPIQPLSLNLMDTATIALNQTDTGSIPEPKGKWT